MKYTIYKITNLINQKIYIGKHQTKNLNDGYFGSGIFLRKAISKYGKENFVKEILFIFDKEEEMNNKEIELINEEFVKSENTYNLGIGGEGGPHFKGRKHTEQSKQKMGRPGRILSPENRYKKAEQMRKLHQIYDLTAIKMDYDLGLKPKKIMEKYKLTKNRYHHIRAYYIKIK